MKGLFLRRGCGKTTLLLYLSKFTKMPIVVSSNARARYLQEKASSMRISIPAPIVFGASTTGLRLDGVLVDDAEHFLQDIIGKAYHVPVIAYTMTYDEETNIYNPMTPLHGAAAKR